MGSGFKQWVWFGFKQWVWSGVVFSTLPPASLAKKRMKEEPIQPMDFHTEAKATPVNPVDSGINN